MQAGAWMFMRFMQQVANQVEWHLVGSYLPATRAAATDSKVKAFWREDLAGRILAVAHRQLLAVDPRRPGPTIGPYPKYDDAIQNALDSMAFKGVSPRQAVATADCEIDHVRRRYAKDNAS